VLPSLSAAASELPDPDSSFAPGETSVVDVQAEGNRNLSLAQLSSRAAQLIIRWSCRGPGDIRLALDGTQRASAPCGGSAGVVTAAIPLAGRHPRTLAMTAPATIHWRVAVSESG
jgi:hypothetical protein